MKKMVKVISNILHTSNALQWDSLAPGLNSSRQSANLSLGIGFDICAEAGNNRADEDDKGRNHVLSSSWCLKLLAWPTSITLPCPTATGGI